MAGWQDDVRKDYEDLKSRFRKKSVDDLKSGDWFADFVQWILSERAMMRLLVPGVNIPIASGFNYYLTRQLLNVAQKQMARRGAVVQPIVRLYAREPRLSKTLGPKVLIAIADLGGSNGVWCEAQMEALRHCQSALSLSDEELSSLDGFFDRSVTDVIKQLPDEFAKGADDLLELAIVQAAFAADGRHDAAYAEGIAALSVACGANYSPETALSKIKTTRRRLS